MGSVAVGDGVDVLVGVYVEVGTEDGTGNGVGVIGVTAATIGVGVIGVTAATIGVGVIGATATTSGVGVFGATATTSGVGVFGATAAHRRSRRVRRNCDHRRSRRDRRQLPPSSESEYSVQLPPPRLWERWARAEACGWVPGLSRSRFLERPWAIGTAGVERGVMVAAGVGASAWSSPQATTVSRVIVAKSRVTSFQARFSVFTWCGQATSPSPYHLMRHIGSLGVSVYHDQCKDVAFDSSAGAGAERHFPACGRRAGRGPRGPFAVAPGLKVNSQESARRHQPSQWGLETEVA